MRSWGDPPRPSPANVSFPGVTAQTKSVGTFQVSRHYTTPNVWYPVQMDTAFVAGFFLPTTRVVSTAYTYSPLPSASPLRLYLQISEVTPEGHIRPVQDKAKAREPFGYLVTVPKTYVYEDWVTSIISRPPATRETETEARVTSSPFLALKLPDLVVHHYPGKLTLVGQGLLPDNLQALLTCI